MTSHMLINVLLLAVSWVAQSSQSLPTSASITSSSSDVFLARSVAAEAPDSSSPPQARSGSYENLHLLRLGHPMSNKTVGKVSSTSKILLGLNVAGAQDILGIRTETINSSLSVTGTVTESGSTTIGKLNSVNYVDGTKFSSIAAAVSDFGSSQGIVVVPSTVSSGAGPSLLSLDNIFVIDQRQVSNPCAQNTHLHFNVKDTDNGNVRQKWIVCDAFQPSADMQASSSSASVEGAAILEGNLNGIGVLEALNGTTIVDSGATNSPSVVIGIEATAKVLGTAANTLSDVRGSTANCSAAGAGNISRCVSVYAQAPAQISTGTIATAESIYAEKPTAGTSSNKSIQADGQVQVGTTGGAGGGGMASAILIVGGTNIALGFNNTGGGPDNKTWDILTNPSDLQIRTVVDNNGSAQVGIDVVRGSGTAITDVTFPPGIKVGSNGTIMTLTQHKRVSTGSIAATTRTEILVTWTNTFTDTNYTVICNVEDSTTAAGSQGLTFERLRTKSATQIGVVINNSTAGAITGTIDCRPDHD